MPVDDASYRVWEGTARPSRRAPFAIAQTMVRRLMRQRLLRGLVIFAPVMACIIASVVFGLMSSGAIPIPTPGGGGPSSLDEVVRSAFPDLNLLALMNVMFFPTLAFLAVVVAAFAGAPLIAEDHRSRALALYFSRPIQRFDYVAGKFLTLFFFLGLFFLAPPICMYLTECAMSTTEGVAGKQFGTFVSSLVPGALACCVLGAIAIGVSSLVERTTHAVLLFFGAVMLTTTFSNVLARSVMRDPDWLAFSPVSAVRRIQLDMLPVPPQYAQAGYTLQMDVNVAWTSVIAWVLLGLGVLVWRIRKVEVVA